MSHRLFSVAALLAALPVHAREVPVTPALAQSSAVQSSAAIHGGAALATLALAPTAAEPGSRDAEAATLAALAERLRRIEEKLGSNDAATAPASGDALAELNQRLLVLERKLELQQDDATAKAATTPILSVGEKGISAKTPDGNFELKFRGLVQADQRSFFGDDSLPFNDTWGFRRIRPTIEGSFGPLVGFRLTPEFAGDNATLIDAYIDLRFNPAYTLRVGKVKGPIGLERLQSAGAIEMTERAFPTELAPNRELGVQLQGELASGRVNYVAGIYNGAPDGRDAPTTDADDHYEFEGRVFFEPWKNDANALSGLGFGLAGSVGDKEGSGNNFLPRYRTPGQNVFFNYRSTVAADGAHQRISPQAYYYRNAFGVLGEFITSKQELVLSGNAASPIDLTNRAWQVTGSWVLTGEDASYKGVVKPAHPFVVGGDGWGAWELVARYGELDIDDDAFPLYADAAVAASRARAWGLGLNWYLNPNLKLVFNRTQTSFDGGAANGGDREDEKTFFSRVQVSF